LRFFGFFRQPPGGHNGGGNGSGGGNGLGSGNPLDTDKGPACAQSDPDKHPLSTGCSWLRLAGDLAEIREAADAIVGSRRQVVAGGRCGRPDGRHHDRLSPRSFGVADDR
jgi:hypothetical protein